MPALPASLKAWLRLMCAARKKDADVFKVAVGHGGKVLLESRKRVNKLFRMSYVLFDWKNLPSK